MKRKKIVIIGGIVLILIITLTFNRDIRQTLLFLIVAVLPQTECLPPERPQNVPLEAKWCGGCDGGEWIYLVPDEYDYHFIIYNDWSGDIRMDGIFIFKDSRLTFNRKNWKEQVLYYNSSSIDSSVCVVIKDSLEFAELICKLPAFGGSDWEVLNEKYSIDLNTTSGEYE